jgi:GAF domain-containing protein
MMLESFVPESARNEIAEQWLQLRPETEAMLQDVFVRHAIDNRGTLNSTRQAAHVASQLHELTLRFILGRANEGDVSFLATELTEQGMALKTGAELMRALRQAAWLEATSPAVKPAAIQLLSNFQLAFLEKLAAARELYRMRVRERSQMAMQQALQAQLERQRQMRRAQEQRSKSLDQVLRLNAVLARITDERALLDQATLGIKNALELADVTIYELRRPDKRWTIRVSTTVEAKIDAGVEPDTIAMLEEAVASDEIAVFRHPPGRNGDMSSIVIPLRIGKKVLGTIRFYGEFWEGGEQGESFILLRTFAQNLSALWRNISLLRETRHRTRELEILHGRYMDRLWSSESAALLATYGKQGLAIDRAPGLSPPAALAKEIPIRIGKRTVGQVRLPDDIKISHDDLDFVVSLIREMGNALNNAHLLQTTSSYSNQLTLAAEVARAATTILERDPLIQEVVELIRARFNVYYVGLFLVSDDGKRAVLRGGTGEEGRLQVERGHQLAVGSHSMIGQVVAEAKARVAHDVSAADAFEYNSLLPETRSELALPLRLRGQVTGALSVQSSETGVFTDETIRALQSLADQLAVAIANANLFAQLQMNLTISSRLYETSRRISEANNDSDVYQSLMEYARQSGLVDAAHIIVSDPRDPDDFIFPIVWHEAGYTPKRELRLSRDRFAFSESIVQNRVVTVVDGQSDSRIDPFTRQLYKLANLHSSAMIPIYVEDSWLGCLALHRKEVRPFTEEELQPFITLADQSGVILSNQQLLRQTELLYRIGRALSQTQSRSEALEYVVSELVQHTGASQGRFVQYDRQSGTGFVVAEHLPKGTSCRARIPTVGDYVYERFIRDGQPILLNADDATVPEEVRRRHLEPFGARVALLIPAIIQQELIGFLALDSPRARELFDPTSIKLAQTTVDHLTTQLENLKLLDEALSRARELITLNQIQSSVSGTLDVNLLARAVFEQIGKLLDNSVFILALYDADSDLYIPLLCMNEGEEITNPSHALLPDGALYRFLKNGEPLFTGTSSAPLQKEAIPSLERSPLSALWVTLQNEGMSIGLIAVLSYEAHAYSENDAQLLRSIATQTSLAIANAQLFEEIQASNEQLRQLDTLKTQFLARMTHELRTPLNSIIGFSRVILKGIDGPLTR